MIEEARLQQVHKNAKSRLLMENFKSMFLHKHVWHKLFWKQHIVYKLFMSQKHVCGFGTEELRLQEDWKTSAACLPTVFWLKDLIFPTGPGLPRTI